MQRYWRRCTSSTSITPHHKPIHIQALKYPHTHCCVYAFVHTHSHAHGNGNPTWKHMCTPSSTGIAKQHTHAVPPAHDNSCAPASSRPRMPSAPAHSIHPGAFIHACAHTPTHTEVACSVTNTSTHKYTWLHIHSSKKVNPDSCVVSILAAAC